ncbi:mechanosensitive ion channel family protein [Pontibacter sp. G13]|uniref:mechanosensitive ion channel family protein n=1 Tax=Pontibacter sp. G13 TaxID=3074898 RepID=UPI002889FF5F|nr:mechanosensitive ion channel family protein [Pontibacter sp. G13]WNJ19485.1 mechanosensitive ion channel family protein [Pontibacter sp. G13]
MDNRTTLEGFGRLVSRHGAAVMWAGLGMACVVLTLVDSGARASDLAMAGMVSWAGFGFLGPFSHSFSRWFAQVKHEINMGDWIETNGFSGKVMEINLRNTKLKEADNNIVVIPNRLIMESPFKNYGLTNRVRTTISCGVAYDSHLPKAKQVAIGAIEKRFGTHPEEPVEFYYTEFGESAIQFILRFWVEAHEKLTALEVKSEAIMSIKESFDQAGIVIPYPIRTILSEESHDP